MSEMIRVSLHMSETTTVEVIDLPSGRVSLEFAGGGAFGILGDLPQVQRLVDEVAAKLGELSMARAIAEDDFNAYGTDNDPLWCDDCGEVHCDLCGEIHATVHCPEAEIIRLVDGGETRIECTGCAVVLWTNSGANDSDDEHVREQFEASHRCGADEADVAEHQANEAQPERFAA